MLRPGHQHSCDRTENREVRQAGKNGKGIEIAGPDEPENYLRSSLPGPAFQLRARVGQPWPASSHQRCTPPTISSPIALCLTVCAVLVQSVIGEAKSPSSPKALRQRFVVRSGDVLHHRLNLARKQIFIEVLLKDSSYASLSLFSRGRTKWDHPCCGRCDSGVDRI